MALEALFLAPLAGYTSLAFRLAVRGCGGLGLATTDLVNARSIVERRRRAFELAETCGDDRPVAIQIYGHVAREMCDAARWVVPHGRYDATGPVRGGDARTVSPRGVYDMAGNVREWTVNARDLQLVLIKSTGCRRSTSSKKTRRPPWQIWSPNSFEPDPPTCQRRWSL